MRGISRRLFNASLCGAMAGTLASPTPARAADFSYRLGHSFLLRHPIHTSLVRAAEKTRTDTNGALDIEVLGANQLGGDTALLSQVRSGSVDLNIQVGSILATLVPVASLWTVGFAFRNYDEVWPAVDGPVGELVRQGMKRVGLVPFQTVWDNGFRQVSTGSKPIITASDLAGLKMRVPVSPILTSMFQALGTAPVNLNFSEVYSALQARLVDGFESPLTVFETGNLYEVQRFIAMTNHVWDGGIVVGNKASLDALPDDIRAIMLRNFDSEGLQQRLESAKLADSLQKTLADRGVTFTAPDTASMRGRLGEKGYYKEWRGKFGEAAWATLTRYSPALA